MTTKERGGCASEVMKTLLLLNIMRSEVGRSDRSASGAAVENESLKGKKGRTGSYACDLGVIKLQSAKKSDVARKAGWGKKRAVTESLHRPGWAGKSLNGIWPTPRRSRNRKYKMDGDSKATVSCGGDQHLWG